MKQYMASHEDYNIRVISVRNAPSIVTFNMFGITEVSVCRHLGNNGLISASDRKVGCKIYIHVLNAQ